MKRERIPLLKDSRRYSQRGFRDKALKVDCKGRGNIALSNPNAKPTRKLCSFSKAGTSLVIKRHQI